MNIAVPKGMLRSQFRLDTAVSFLPLYPRLLNELVVIPFGEELLIEGTERLQAISAAGVKDLLPLLDGKRTLNELNSALPTTHEESLIETLESLYRWGLIEDGAITSSEHSNPDTLAFLRRHLGLTHSNRSGVEAYERLRRSEVLIACSDPACDAAESLASLLTRSGVGRTVHVNQIPAEWQPRSSASISERLLVSVSVAGDEYDRQTKLDAWCFERQLPWLRLTISPQHSYADIGPLFNGERMPCYLCFHSAHCAPHDGSRARADQEAIFDVHFWTAMAAVEVVFFLTRIAPLATDRCAQRYDLESYTSRKLCPLRVPGCSRCRPLTLHEFTGKGFPEVSSALVFEEYVCLPSRPCTSESVSHDYAVISSSLAIQAKRMPNCTRLPLSASLRGLERPALEVLQGALQPREPAITIDDVSLLLLTTAGFRDAGSATENLQRWTATAGNLGSVELFVIVREVEGLPPGVYLYQAQDHCLAQFEPHRDVIPIPILMQRVACLNRSDLPPLMIVLTGAYHRLERKYHEFAYKLVNLDAGVAVGQIHFAARALNLVPVTALRWADDLLEETLNLDPFEEHVTGIVPIYCDENRELGARSGAGSVTHSQTTPCVGSTSGLYQSEPAEVVKSLYRESRMRELEYPRIAVQSSGVHAHPLFGPSISFELPRPNPFGAASINDVLSARKTVRHYALDSIAPDQLAFILECAARGDQEFWREEHFAQPLSFYVLAWNVAGLQAAVYLYDAKRHGLHWVAAARSWHDNKELFVQPEFGSAAAVIWMAADLSSACARLGALGHRMLLLRAGAAAHRLWMASLALGLSGGITAGLVSGAAREQFGVDGYQDVSLVGFAVGVASRLQDDEAQEED